MNSIPGAKPLPPVAQMGFVFRDMDAALARFEPLYGPFTRIRFENKGFEYRGTISDCVVDVAFVMTGELEIELIQPVSGSGPHAEFLLSGREGLHHLQHRLDDIGPYIAQLAEQGYECIWRKRSRPNSAVAYMVHSDYPLVVELVEPLKRAERKA